MRHVTLAGADITVSRFILGPASLFNASSPATRRRLLDPAYNTNLL